MSDVDSRLGEAIHALLFPLREGREVDQEQMRAFQELLEDLRNQIVDEERKVDADIALKLVEVFPLMLGIAPNHKESGLIEDWAIDIQSTIVDVLGGRRR